MSKAQLAQGLRSGAFKKTYKKTNLTMLKISQRQLKAIKDKVKTFSMLASRGTARRRKGVHLSWPRFEYIFQISQMKQTGRIN